MSKASALRTKSFFLFCYFFEVRARPDLPHYFIGSGNQYGAAYSYAMCYWEEQMWIRTKSISCQEFFHGMQEIIVSDTPVTLFMGDSAARSWGRSPGSPACRAG